MLEVLWLLFTIATQYSICEKGWRRREIELLYWLFLFCCHTTLQLYYIGTRREMDMFKSLIIFSEICIIIKVYKTIIYEE